MQLAGDVTRQDIKDIIESHFGGAFWNEASRLGVTVDVTVEPNLTPHIEFETNNPNIRVRITTVDLISEEDEHVGWAFNPHVINSGIHFNFADDDNPVAEYAEWCAIAKLVQQIYEFDFYPEEYFD